MDILKYEINIKSTSIDKLIDICSNAIGKFCAPVVIKRIAEAKKQEIITIGTAIKDIKGENSFVGDISYKSGEIEIVSTGSGIDANKIIVELERRITDRINTIEARRQRNIDFVTIHAMKELSGRQIESEKTVDEDWINNFFNYAQNISNDQMQVVWGKILAGEIVRPGSFSLRSIEALRTMSRAEAKIFQQVVQYMFKVESYGYLIHTNKLLSLFPIGDSRIWRMKEIGMIQAGIISTIFSFDSAKSYSFVYGKYSLNVYPKKEKDDFKLDVYPLTKIGYELSKLIDLTPDLDYFNESCVEIERKGVIVDKNII